MATIPVLLPRKSHGQRSPAGASPWGSESQPQLCTNDTGVKSGLETGHFSPWCNTLV